MGNFPSLKSSFRLLLRLLATLVVACYLPSPALLAGQPNVVVILTDDQGWGDLSLHGNTNLSTPHIDSLARDGAQFDRFFVCPVCSPTRAEFLTGRYHPRSGVYSTSAGGERMDLDEVTIADVFRAAGYRTAAFGKWHNGMQYPYHPNGRGFELFYGFCSGHWGNYFDPMLERNGEIIKGNGFLVDDLTSQAMKFMEQHREEPFFVYLPYNTPHSPMQVPDAYWERFQAKELKMHHRDGKENDLHLRAALAMCENIDWNVGRILAKLHELHVEDDTIVVFFHDNGPNGNRWNGDMKGRKGSTDEGGVRSPLLVRYPAKVSAGRNVKQIAGAIDLLPTLSQLAGIETPQIRKPLDGRSLVPLLENDGPVDWPERLLFSHWRGRVSVRSQRYRLDAKGNLFDLVNDPGQRSPLENLAIAKRMQKAVDAWKRELLPELESDERPFVVGHPEYAVTQLPARDAQFTGSIRRSNRFPNCSFLTNWISKDDTIYWDIEVPRGGLFDVEVYYTCPSRDVGATVELSFLDEHARGKVSVAHDPPLQGAEHDRSPRAESYVKEFRPLSLGTLQLKKGRGRIALRAVEMPGDQVMDFRLMMLRRRL